MCVWICHGRKHFLSCPWFSFVLSIQILLLAPDPYVALPTSFWNALLPFVLIPKCFLGYILCSRYCINIRDIKVDRPGIVPVLMEGYSSTQTIWSQFSSSSTQDLEPYAILMSLVGLVKYLNDREGLHTPTMT